MLRRDQTASWTLYQLYQCEHPNPTIAQEASSSSNSTAAERILESAPHVDLGKLRRLVLGTVRGTFSKRLTLEDLARLPDTVTLPQLLDTGLTIVEMCTLFPRALCVPPAGVHTPQLTRSAASEWRRRGFDIFKEARLRGQRMGVVTAVVAHLGWTWDDLVHVWHLGTSVPVYRERLDDEDDDGGAHVDWPLLLTSLELRAVQCNLRTLPDAIPLEEIARGIALANAWQTLGSFERAKHNLVAHWPTSDDWRAFNMTRKRVHRLKIDVKVILGPDKARWQAEDVKFWTTPPPPTQPKHFLE